MTIDKKETVTLPKWLVILVAPMLISGVVSISFVSLYAGGLKEKVEKTEIEVKDLDQSKVDRNEAIQMQGSLNRIESKLDSYILKNTSK